MSALVRPLAESVRVHTNRRVHTLQRIDKGWHLWFDDQTSSGPFAAVAVAVPAPEASLILGREAPDLADQIGGVRFSPCWALMIRLEEKVLPDYDAYSDMSQVIRWVGRNNKKPGRSSRGEHIVVHASPAWTRETEDAEAEAVAEELWSEVCHLLDLPPVRPQQMGAYLWRHGLVEQPLGETYVLAFGPDGRRGGRLVSRAVGGPGLRERSRAGQGDGRRVDLTLLHRGGPRGGGKLPSGRRPGSGARPSRGRSIGWPIPNMMDFPIWRIAAGRYTR